MPSQYYWSAAGSLYFVATVATIAFVAWVDRKVRSCCSSKVGSETTNFHIFVQALIWNGGSRGRVQLLSTLQDIYTRVYRYILFVTVVTSWWLGITFGNAAYFAVITFTTVGLGDFAPPSRPASRRRVDGVGVEAAARAGSSTTTRRTPTWSASTSSSRRRRSSASCCSPCS